MGGWTIMMRRAMLASALAGLALVPALAADPEKFKDWELFCPAPKPKDQPRICEVRTIITSKEGAKLGALAIALDPEPGAQALPMIATALLPLGVDLTRAPALIIGDSQPLPLQFRRCLQRGCEAVALIDAAHLKALRAGTLAKVAVGLGDGRKAVFEFSLAGFTAAHDAIKQRVGKT